MIDQDIQSRVDAYRGNPQALQQKYAQNQQLIDLLALQRLKSEKESAAREMALKMGGQGGQKPTIAQQREQEVLDMTKQEVAQEQGGVAAHQQKQQQDAMKALLQQQQQGAQQVPQPMQQAPQQPQAGIAQLPAPNISAQGMATGGIVAFAEAGAVDDGAPETEEERQARLKADIAKAFVNSETSGQAALPYRRQATAKGKEPPAPYTFLPPQEKIADVEAMLKAVPPAVAADTKANASPQVTPAQAQPTGIATPPAKPTAPPAGAGGIGVLPAGGTDAFGSKVKSAAEGLMGLDHIAEAKRVRDEQMQFAGFTPEQKAKKEKMLADMEAYDKQAYSPERQRMEGLTRFLLGAGGRSAGQELGGAGAASETYRDQMREAQRQRMNERSKQQNEYMNLDQGIREKAFEGGEKASKDALTSKAQGVNAGTNLYNTDTQAAIERMKTGIMADANKIAKAQASTDKARVLLESITSHRNAELSKIDNQFSKDAGLLLQMQLSGAALNPAQEKQLNLLQSQAELKRLEINRSSIDLRRQVESQLGINTGASGLKFLGEAK